MHGNAFSKEKKVAREILFYVGKFVSLTIVLSFFDSIRPREFE